jgi:hypothetical protein
MKGKEMRNIVKTCASVGALCCSFSGDCMIVNEHPIARSQMEFGVDLHFEDATTEQAPMTLKQAETFCKIDLAKSMLDSPDLLARIHVWDTIFPHRHTAPHTVVHPLEGE